MKRRTIVLAPAVAGSTLAAGTSLYGTPGSASAAVARERLRAPRMTVQLAKQGLPAEAIAPAVQMAAIVDTLFSSARARQALREDPAGFFERHGITFPVDVSPAMSADAALFRALISKPAMDALQRGDVSGYMAALEQVAAVPGSQGASDMAQRIADAVGKDRDALGAAIADLVEAAQGLPEHGSGNELQVLAELMKKFERDDVVPLCTTSVCALYLVVAVGSWVIAVATVAVAVTAWVSLGVFTDPFVKAPALSSRGGTPGRLLQSMAPAEMRRYGVAIRVARMRGEHGTARELARQAYGLEVKAMLDGIEQSGRFDLSGGRRQKLESALLAYVATWAAALEPAS